MQQLIFEIAATNPRVGVQATGVRENGPAALRAEQARLFNREMSDVVEPWRMTYHADRGGAIGHLHDEPKREVRVIDAGGWSEDAVVAHFAAQMASEPPRLDAIPAGWNSHYIVAPDTYYSISCASHIGHDAVSIYQRQQALQDFVTDLDAGRRARIARPAHLFREYVEWEGELLRSATSHTRLDYWKRRLKGVTALDLPLDAARGPAGPGRLGSVRAFADAHSQLFDQHKHELGVSYFDFACAAFLLTLARFSGHADVVLGVPFSVRSILPAFKDTPGPMVDYLPLRINLDECSTGMALLAHVQQAKREAIANYLPVGYLLEQLGYDWRGNPTPLLQCLVNVLPSVNGAPALLLDRPGDRVSSANAENSRPLNLVTKGSTTLERQDLSLLAMRHGGELRWRIGVRTDLFGPETAAVLEATYERLGGLLLENPSAAVRPLIES